MTNPFVVKLEQFTRLSEEDKRVLHAVSGETIRRYGPDADIAREGEPPRVMRLILSGWACRYKHLPDGRRQIVALFLPGDLCDHNVYVLSSMDHSIGALTAVTLAEITPAGFETLLAERPRVTQALYWETLVNAAVHREWIVNLGQRVAPERLAHLFCELFHRFRSVGMTEGDSYEMPLTQTQLGDVTGMSAVHVNRSIQDLRKLDLFTLKSRRLSITNLAGLQGLALFNPNYLHLDHVGARFDAL